MASEIPKLHIPLEITDSVMEEIHNYEATIEFVNQTIGSIRKVQPDLYQYLKETSRKLEDYDALYAMHMSLAYEIVARFLRTTGRTIRLTKEDMDRHKRMAEAIYSDPRLEEEKWVLEQTQTTSSIRTDSGIGLFLNVMDSVAPELGSYAADLVALSDDPEFNTLIMRGFYDGFMPFYSKIRLSTELAQ